MLCREQVAQLRDVHEDIEARGAQLVVVGQGTPEQAADFAQRSRLPFTLLVDPDLEAYRAAGLRRGAVSTLRPGAIVNGLRAWRSGHRQGSTKGDPWQQGGVFVILPRGEVPFAYVSREAGDHPAPAAFIAALP